MITKEGLQKVNTGLKTIDQKGKAYVMVNTRVQAFRELEPAGSITTDILSLVDGVCVIKATITDEHGQVLSTGLACEKENSSFVNKTSYIENCETSAVGRALGFLGIGIDAEISSADENANAMHQQKLLAKATEREKKSFKELCESAGLDPVRILKEVGATDWNITKQQHGLAMKRYMELSGGK